MRSLAQRLTVCFIYLASLCCALSFSAAQAQLLPDPPQSRYGERVHKNIAQDAPIKAVSENFTLIGGITPETGESLLRDLEGFRSFMRHVYEAQPWDTDQHVRIYFITDEEIYAELSPTNSTSAFYYNSLTGPEIVLNGSPQHYDPQWTRHDLFHEYMHHVNRHYLDYNTPTWLNEGLAEYYAKSEVLGDGFVTGHVHAQHIAVLREHDWTQLSLLFNTLHGYPYPDGAAEKFGVNIDARQGMFYAQSWLIVHYLMQQEGGMETLRGFIAALDPAGDNAQPFKAAFDMDYESFTEALETYAQQDSLTEAYVTLGAIDPPAVSSAPIERRDHISELYLLMSQAAEAYQSGKPQARIDAELLESGEMSAMGYLARASRDYFDGDHEAAANSIAKADALAPDAPRVKQMKAILGFYIWQAQYDPNGDYEADTVRSDLRSAISQNPQHLDLKLMFVSTFDPVTQAVDAELRGMIDSLLRQDFIVKNPDNSLAMIAPLQKMGRYSDIYDIIDIGEVWIRDRALRYRTQGLRFRIKTDEQRAR